MSAIWFCHHYDREGAVRLRIQGFDAIGCVTRIAGAVERRVRIILLRLGLEYGDDLSLHVDAAIVIVVQARCGDSEAREHKGCRDLLVVMKAADDVGCMPR